MMANLSLEKPQQDLLGRGGRGRLSEELVRPGRVDVSRAVGSGLNRFSDIQPIPISKSFPLENNGTHADTQIYALESTTTHS
jgi:hypothetical protein